MSGGHFYLRGKRGAASEPDRERRPSIPPPNGGGRKQPRRTEPAPEQNDRPEAVAGAVGGTESPAGAPNLVEGPQAGEGETAGGQEEAEPTQRPPEAASGGFRRLVPSPASLRPSGLPYCIPTSTRSIRGDQPIRVLLVDDDLGDFEMIRVMLSQAEHGNYKLDWVSNYEEALDAFRAKEHDVYLLDYFLEDRSGLDLLKEAEGHGVTAPIIMLTGGAAVRWIWKPWKQEPPITW